MFESSRLNHVEHLLGLSCILAGSPERGTELVEVSYADPAIAIQVFAHFLCWPVRQDDHRAVFAVEVSRVGMPVGIGWRQRQHRLIHVARGHLEYDGTPLRHRDPEINPAPRLDTEDPRAWWDERGPSRRPELRRLDGGVQLA